MTFKVFLLLMVSGAALVHGQGNSEFPQSQGQGQSQTSQKFGGGDAEFGRPQAANGAAARPGPAQNSSDARAHGDAATERGNPNDRHGPNGDAPNNALNAGSVEGAREGDRGVAAKDVEQRRDGGDESAAHPMDLDDARENFAAVVEGYVAKRSAKGYWTYIEKQGGKPRRLVGPSVDEESIQARERSRFSGRVKLKDARGGKPVALEFVVDFSGVEWKVVEVKPAVAASVSTRR
jgi:hypothetical protein